MDVFRTVAAQIDAVRLPLFTVTLTAVPRGRTPLLLMLHWHGFRTEPEGRPNHKAAEPVPSSALQLNTDWAELEQIDRLMLDAAWQLGAWDLAREERRACNTAGASEREALECRQAFGDDPLGRVGETRMVAEAPDRADMMQLGARVGYIRWAFRPVRGGIWREGAQDDTLSADGSRAPPCPAGVAPTAGRQAGMTRVRLGRISRLILP
jgi:hypothetical protein